jgi:crotonobetainyl-CoA:carnitine CoA-transferase CaiB-like acyl-CoA transferase
MRDGEEILFGIQNNREWTTFCVHVLERPALADDPRFQGNRLRVQHRADVNTEIRAVFDEVPAGEIIRRLEAAQIANARLNTVEQFIEHPQLAGRDAWREIASPVGPIRALVPPVRMEDVEPAMGAIPGVGEHRDAILTELGFDRATIERWKTEGII